VAEEEDLQLDKPIAMRCATRTRRVPARFGKSGDILPSAQLAAMNICSQVVTPESSPPPSPAASLPSISRPPSPMPVDMPSPKPTIHETIPNQFGLYRRFETWPSVDPENDVTIDDLIDAPTFLNTTDRGYRKAEEAFGLTETSSNPFAPYLNATHHISAHELVLPNWLKNTQRPE
jgi:hypothetical protein